MAVGSFSVSVLIAGTLLINVDSLQNRRLPALPAQFTLHQEVIDVQGKKLASVRELFDYEGKLARTDLVPPLKSDLANQYGQRPLIVVSDFKTGYRYVMDRWWRNCSMDSLPPHSWVSESGPDNYITMKHSYALFDKLKAPGNYIYKGETTIRNISVDQWTKVSSASDEHIFILKHDWSSTPEESQATITDVPVGLKISTYKSEVNHELISEQVYHIYDFYSGHPERQAFDIEDCFSFATQYKTLMFMTEGSYLENVYGKHEQVYTAFTNAIAKHAQISTLRVTRLFFSQTVPLHLDVYFTLMETPAELYNIKNTTTEPSLADAYENLEAAIKAGFKVSVPYKLGTKDVKVVESSLTERRKTYVGSYGSGLKQYSPGAMAGLGIGMILLGFILGVIGAYIIQKRFNTEVPYKIS